MINCTGTIQQRQPFFLICARTVVITLFLLIFFVLRADPGNSRESSVLTCEENSIVRIRNMKEKGYNETKEVLTTIDAMKSLRDTSLH